MFEDDFVFETDNYRFYENGMTSLYKRRMMEYDTDGIAPTQTFRVYLVENKTTGEREYVAYDRDGVAFMNWTDSYLFDFKMLAYRLELKDDANIVNMAKKVKRC